MAVKTCGRQGQVSNSDDIHEDGQGKNESSRSRQEPILPGFRFHPTDEELVGFYLLCKVSQRPLTVEVITQLDIYKFDPWDLPKMAAAAKGERECYFFCRRDRKYRNSARPNRVTASGFWKATGTDRPIYSSSRAGPTKCIGLKKSLVFYRGRASKGTKTDWMMHEFRLPSASGDTHGIPHLEGMNVEMQADSWALCRIFKKTTLANRPTQPSPISDPSTQHLYGPGAQIRESDELEMMPDSPLQEQESLDLSYEQVTGPTKPSHGKELREASAGADPCDPSDPSECNSSEYPGANESAHMQGSQAASELPQMHSYKLYALDMSNNHIKQEDVNLLHTHNLQKSSRASDNNLEKMQHQHTPSRASQWVSVGERSMNSNEEWIRNSPGLFRRPRPPTTDDVMHNKVSKHASTHAGEDALSGPGKHHLILRQRASSSAADADLDNKTSIHEHSASSTIPNWTVQLPRIPSGGSNLGMDEFVKHIDVPNGSKHSNYNPGSSSSISIDSFNSFLMEPPVIPGGMDFMSTINTSFNPPPEATGSDHLPFPSSINLRREGRQNAHHESRESPIKAANSSGLEYARNSKELTLPALETLTDPLTYSNLQHWDLSAIFGSSRVTPHSSHANDATGSDCM